MYKRQVKIVYVDSPANVDAEATFSTDNKAAGKTAGEEMLKALEAAGVTSGSIGIINVNAATDSCVMREEGFRSAFEGKGFTLLETQYGEGDAAKSQSIAENYITQGVAGIFGCNEGSTTGAGNAIKASGKDGIIGVGFDKSDAILGLIDDGYLLCTCLLYTSKTPAGHGLRHFPAQSYGRGRDRAHGLRFHAWGGEIFQDNGFRPAQ